MATNQDTTPQIPDDLINRYGVIDRQPRSTNPLIQTTFRFTIQRIPGIVWACQTANLPGMVLGNASQPTPFTDISRPGKIQFEDLSIQFIVDEYMENWKQLSDWIRKTTNVEDFEEYDVNKIYTDGTLDILSNKLKTNVQITFKNISPVSLSGIEFDLQAPSSEPVTATASFTYTSYILDLKNIS